MSNDTSAPRHDMIGESGFSIEVTFLGSVPGHGRANGLFRTQRLGVRAYRKVGMSL